MPSNSRQRLLELMSKRKPKWRPFMESSFETKLAAALTLVEGISASRHLDRVGVPYAIVGGIASIYWGSPRTTHDIDILVRKQDLQKALDALSPHSDPEPLTIDGVSIETNGLTVDLLCPEEPWVPEAISTAVPSEHGKMVIPPYLVLMKMESARGARDDLDMSYAFKRMDEQQVELTRRIVAKYRPSDVEDVDTLIAMSELY